VLLGKNVYWSIIEESATGRGGEEPTHERIAEDVLFHASAQRPLPDEVTIER